MAQWYPLEKDDAQCSATLEAAFAFIDAFNEELRTDETNGSLAPGPETFDDHTRTCASDPLSPSKPRVGHCGNHDDNSKRKDVCNGRSLKRALSTRRKSPDAGNTMRVRNYRRRNKAEIQELRTKVARMEAQLAQLQSRSGCQQQKQQDGHAWLPSFLDNLTAQPELQAHRRIYSASYSGVHSERKKRLQSESTNRQLKQIFFVLLEMGASVDKFLHMNVTAPDINALFGIDTLQTETFARSLPATADVTLLDLHQDLECVYVSAKVKYMLNPAIENACSSSQVRADTERGPVYEFSASTPLQCRFQALNKHLNSHMDRLRRTTSLSTTQTKSGCKTVAQAHFTMVVSSPHYGQFYLDGVSVLGKYDEVDRSVIACTSRLTLRGTGLVFHEKSYLAFVNGVQTEDSSPSSLCQIDYHIFAVPEAKYYPTKLRDFVLTNQWRRMQAHQLEVQNVLLHELDALVTEGKPRSELLAECPVRHAYSIC